MAVNTMDWIATVFFLAALVMVRKFQSQIRAESREGFRHLAGGLAFLSMATLARLFYGLGYFSRVPFLSETLFFDLAYWILVLAGGALMVNGASEWLPLARQNRKLSQQRIDRLELLHRVQQLVGVENRVDAILSTTLQYMQAQIEFSAGAVFQFSAFGDDLSLIALTSEFPMERLRFEESVSALFAGRRREEKIVDASRCLLDCLPSGMGRPAVVIPVRVSQHVVGSFVLWSDRKKMDPDDSLLLQLAVNVVAAKIGQERGMPVASTDEFRTSWLSELQREVVHASDTRQRFSALARGLAKQVPYDNLALALVKRSRSQMTRYSYGIGGQILVEAHLPVPPFQTVTSPAYETDKMIVHNGLDAKHQPVRSEIITSGPVNSLLAMPVRVHDDFTAVLTLASINPGAFGPWERETVQEIQAAAALTVMPDIMDAERRRNLARLEKVARLIGRIDENPLTHEAAMEIAGLVADDTGADVVRVALLDETGAFLESQAVALSTPTVVCVPANGQMILSLMPNHVQALNNCRTVKVTSATGQNGLTPIEARQVFNEDVKSATIVPLVSGGRAIGVITMGHVGEPLTVEDQSRALGFIEAAASALGERIGAVSVNDLDGRITGTRHAIPEESDWSAGSGARPRDLVSEL